MKTIDELKDLEEYKEHYLAEHVEFRRRALRFDKVNNSTSDYLFQRLNYEGRQKIIKTFKSSGVPSNHIEKLEGVHMRIYKEYEENFDSHNCKLELFHFCELMNEIKDNFVDESDSDDKIEKFLQFKDK